MRPINPRDFEYSVYTDCIKYFISELPDRSGGTCKPSSAVTVMTTF